MNEEVNNLETSLDNSRTSGEDINEDENTGRATILVTQTSNNNINSTMYVLSFF